MIHDIREAFNELLEENDWMDPETRKVAEVKNLFKKSKNRNSFSKKSKLKKNIFQFFLGQSQQYDGAHWIPRVHH